MWFRCLLPLLAVLALLGGSVTAYAAAGLVGDTECCCPDPTTCTCHDHDGAPSDAAEMKRCGGEAERIAPVVVAAVLPTVLELIATRTISTLVYDLPPVPEARSSRIDKPPI